MRVSVAFAQLAAASASQEAAAANPIRRVVNMLQGIQAKLEEEAKTAESMFEKFQCYCQSNEKKLEKSIEDAATAITRLEASIDSTAAEKKQTEADLKTHKEERAAAKSAIEEATSMRSKENADFSAESGDLKANIGALNEAIPAIEKGMAGSFLQTQAGSQLSKIAEVSMQLTDGQKSELQAFLQGTSEYAPASGQIVGILKTMKDEMEANLAEITKNENEAAAAHNGMVAAKNSEIAASTAAIEEKTARAGDLAVQVVTEKNDLKETVEQKAADEEYLSALKADCQKTAEDQAAASKARATELVAIADTIKMLNSDEALELFKKTLPSPSLLQIRQSEQQLRRSAAAALRGHGFHSDLVLLALQGKKQGFEQVLDMIEKMVKSLAKEQEDDDEKKAYCNSEIDKTEDEGKELANAISTLETRIEANQQDITALKGGIKELAQSIKDLDKAVEEATAQRKAEHEAYVEEAANNNAALDLLGMAKNRLAKVYSPETYEEAPKRELSDEEKISEAYSFVQLGDAPEAPPAVAGHANADAGGVVALMANIINDLKKEMQENEFAEKDAQEDYEKLMKDSAAKRAADSASISEKEGALAELEDDMNDARQSQRSKMGQLEDSQKYTVDLHKTCDFLLENYGARKEARENEMEGLKKAKEVLSGADFGLVQTKSFLKRQ
mmetsp:Transcript_42236/g.101615  ORF Transcript_42236/g.101615 Transcript_42236/m.101615 type:complete len:675 (-) Transcript_42236:73-2097(-)